MKFTNAIKLAEFIVSCLNAQHPNSSCEGASEAKGLDKVWIEGEFDLLKLAEEVLNAY